MEATQDQVMIRVVPCVLDRHVLEQKTFCYQDVVGPGAHLLSSAAHIPSPAVLQPQLVLWEEVSTHVLETCRGHGCRNLLVPWSALWHCQVGVEISDHQQSSPPGPLADGHDDTLLSRRCMGPSSTP